MKNKHAPQLKGQAADNKNTFDSYSTAYIKQFRRAVLTMSIFPVLVLMLSVGVFFSSLRDNGTEAAVNLAPKPTQPAGFFYNNTMPSTAWNREGAMVICGRGGPTGTNCGNQQFKNISAAKGTVLVYFDAIVHCKTSSGAECNGYYHDMLIYASICGPQEVKDWPNAPRNFNTWGPLLDMRIGSPLQAKLECVLEKIVSDNPHMGGFFADDLGGDNGATQAGVSKEEYYTGAVNIVKTFRKVADRHGLMVIANGAWEGGHNAGYPVRSTHGNALVDGVCVEHHINGEISYWTNYLKNGQWAQQSPLTQGTPFHIVITEPGDTFNTYLAPQFNGYIANQHEYSNAGEPWGQFHPTGLPYRVSGITSPAPTSPAPTPPSPTPPTPTPAPTPTAKPATPTGLKLTSGENKITVTWNTSPASEKVDNYQVYLNGSYSYTNTTSPTYTISGTPGQSFSVRVSAHNSAGYGPWTTSITGVVGSAPGTPAPTPTPVPPPPAPLPPITVPGASTTKPVPIPVNLPVASDGTVIADFNGDGLNEVAQDTNKDGQIDPATEIVIDGVNNRELTDMSQPAISSDELYSSGDLKNYELAGLELSNPNVTINTGVLPEITIPKPVAYSFVIAQAIAVSGLGAYLAITKLAILSGLRGRLGL